MFTSIRIRTRYGFAIIVKVDTLEEIRTDKLPDLILPAAVSDLSPVGVRLIQVLPTVVSESDLHVRS